ncbi:hypothetical protein Tsubulata_010987 [Turnera subulata]|uniref:G-patch domain-containing protein n=1 Tax=Turnera subulata TaxID=218843 RepID=A0A9Q0G1U3_9ROSI|nr:hypothetical protein Tsubulata_010987 [Turnera subulata]
MKKLHPLPSLESSVEDGQLVTETLGCNSLPDSYSSLPADVPGGGDDEDEVLPMFAADQPPLIIPPVPKSYPYKRLKKLHPIPSVESSAEDAQVATKTLGNSLPDSSSSLRAELDREFAEFEVMPVDCFAKALLKSYGWREGMGVGKNAKEDVKVKQYPRITARAGLGFSDALKIIKPDDDEDPEDDDLN